MDPSNKIALFIRKMDKQTFLVFVGVSITIVGVIFTIGFLISQNIKPKSTKKVNVTATPTPTEIQPRITDVVRKINHEANFTILTNKQIINISPNTDDTNILLQNNSIKGIYDWDENNEYLVVNYNGNIALLDKEKKKLSLTEYKVVDETVNVDKNKFNFIQKEQGKTIITSVEIPSRKAEKSELPLALPQKDISFNNALTKFIYLQDSNIYYYSKEAKVEKNLNSFMADLTGFNLGFWLNDDEYIFSTNTGIYVFDSKYEEVIKAVNFTSNEKRPLNTINLAYVKETNSIYFIFESKLFKYSIDSKSTRQIEDLIEHIDLSDSVTLSVTPNEKYATFIVDKKALILNLQTKSLVELYAGRIDDVTVEK